MFHCQVQSYFLIHLRFTQSNINKHHYSNSMRKQSYSKQQIFAILKTTIYYALSFALTAFAILTCPFWMPVYFFYTSIHKSYVILKTLMKLPPKLLKLKKQPNMPAYAVLKGNGRYLKGTDDDYLIYQMYDYTVRKFLTVGKLEPQMKIAQLQFTDYLGLQYLHKNCMIRQLTGISSSEKTKPTLNALSLQVTNYQIESFSSSYDCILGFNLRQKLPQKIDILKILTYIKHHLSRDGYAVLGQFLQQGQVNVLKELFQVYGFKIAAVEDITKNVKLAQKKIREKKQQSKYEQFLLDLTHEKVLSFAGINKKENNLKYYCFVLQKV